MSKDLTERKIPSRNKTRAYRGVMGRPTKYRPEMAQELIDYFNVQPFENVEVVNKQTGAITFAEIVNPLPTLAGFAAKSKVCRDTLYEWANKIDENGNLFYPDFSYAIKLAKECQEHVLVTNTLMGRYQPSFAAFTAKNLLNWRDNQDLTISGNVEKPLVTINSEMTPEQAALIYKDSLGND